MIYVIPPETDLSAVGRGYEMLDAATKCAAAAGLYVHDARQLVVCADPAQVLLIGTRFNSAAVDKADLMNARERWLGVPAAQIADRCRNSTGCVVSGAGPSGQRSRPFGSLCS
jgi:hypothetical protein